MPEEHEGQEQAQEQGQEQQQPRRKRSQSQGKRKQGTGNGHMDASEVLDTLRQIAGAVSNLDERIEVLEQGNGARSEDTGEGADEDLDLTVPEQSGENGQGNEAWSDQDKAAVRLAQYMFDTPDTKLSQMTETPRRMIVPMTLVEAINQYIENVSKGKRILLSSVWTNCFDRRMRSLDGKHLMRGMAMSQVESEKEEADRELGKDEL